MKKILQKAFVISELEPSIRNLHVTYIGSRKEMNKISLYLTIASQTTSDSHLAGLIEHAAKKINECISGISVGRRIWENSFLDLYEGEQALEDIYDYLDAQKNSEHYKNIEYNLSQADQDFGIRSILDNMMAAIVEALDPMIYLHSILRSLYDSPYNNKDIEDTCLYLHGLIIAIQDKEKEKVKKPLSVQDIVNFIKVFRYIQDTLTIRMSGLLRQ